MKKVILKNGQEIILRPAVVSDGEKLLEYKAIVATESENLTFNEEEAERDIERERSNIMSFSESDNSSMTVATYEDEIIGLIVFVGGKRARLKHVGSMGITVKSKFWGRGVGGCLIEFLINWAKDTKIIRKINLQVRIDNEKAIKLYLKHGFEKEGIITRDLCIDGILYDSFSMGLKLD